MLAAGRGATLDAAMRGWLHRHHEVFRHLARADRVLLFLNLLLLLFVAAIPFPTAVLAEHLGGRADAHSAALAYSMVMLLMGVSFGLLWGWSVRGGRLLHRRLDPAEACAAVRRFALGNLAYLLRLGWHW